MKKYAFADCGCQFDVISEIDDKTRIILRPDVEELPLTCPRTWKLLSAGDTKGVFQLESPLGRSTAKKLQPQNIEELGALIALIRPGCLESYIGDKNITTHFIERKHGREPTTYHHPALENSLKKTYGLLVYQEQAMQIVKDIANFNLLEAENLRKAIGKKDTATMTKVKTMFMEKAIAAKVVTHAEAEEIFSWIRAAQRYSFNKSHSISYAYNGYLSAYCKAHFIYGFFTSYLWYNKEKIKPREEMRELVNNAKNYGINVCAPDFRKLVVPSEAPVPVRPSLHFMLRDRTIYAGFSDVKGVGETEMDNLFALVPKIESELGLSYTQWTWMHFLLFCAPHIKKTVVHALIQVGALQYMGPSRMRMLYEYDALRKLTDKELKVVQGKYDIHDLHFVDVLQRVAELPVGKDGGVANKNRLLVFTDIIASLINPPYKLEDSADWIAGVEESLIGIPLTCTRVEGKDISAATCTCHEFIEGKQGYVIIAGQVNNVNEIKTKSGKKPGSKMAFLTISDNSGSLDNVVAFPDAWAEHKGIMVSGNLILVGGEKGKDNSLIVKNAWQL